MARIAGIDLPRSKRIDIALTYIYGVGRSRAVEICAKAEVEGATKTEQLGEGEVIRLREIIEREYQVEGDLRHALVDFETKILVLHENPPFGFAVIPNL